jgi:hypothetical protein
MPASARAAGMFGGGPASISTKAAFREIWSKPGEALLEEFDFRRCHLFVHFLLLFAA